MLIAAFQASCVQILGHKIRIRGYRREWKDLYAWHAGYPWCILRANCSKLQELCLLCSDLLVASNSKV
jgi:hypothetical protein